MKEEDIKKLKRRGFDVDQTMQKPNRRQPLELNYSVSLNNTLICIAILLFIIMLLFIPQCIFYMHCIEALS